MSKWYNPTMRHRVIFWTLLSTVGLLVILGVGWSVVAGPLYGPQEAPQEAPQAAPLLAPTPPTVAPSPDPDSALALAIAKCATIASGGSGAEDFVVMVNSVAITNGRVAFGYALTDMAFKGRQSRYCRNVNGVQLNVLVLLLAPDDSIISRATNVIHPTMRGTAGTLEVATNAPGLGEFLGDAQAIFRELDREIKDASAAADRAAALGNVYVKPDDNAIVATFVQRAVDLANTSLIFKAVEIR